MLYFSRWKVAFISLTIFLGALFAMPNALSSAVRDSLPGFIPSSTINLGLDLQGGSHLLYEVDINDVRIAELETSLDRARTIIRDDGCDDRAVASDGLFCADITADAVLDDYATLRISDRADYDEALERLRRELPRPEGNAGLTGALNSQPRLFDVTEGANGEIEIRVTEESLAEVRRRTIGQSIEIIRRRIDELGTTEPLIVRQGANRILVQAPGLEDPARLKEIIGRTAQMTFHLVASANPTEIQRALDGRVSPLQMLLPTDNPTEPYLLVEKRLRVRDTVVGPDRRTVRVLSGAYLSRASQGFHYQTGEAVVNFTFNTTGARIFSKMTSNHTRERFAVVLDGQIITAPRILSPITGGSGFIEGNFTVESASDLAALLNAGALPAPLTIVEERTVGPGLGKDSVDAGTRALIIGFAAVMIFMLIAYGPVFGTFSVIALMSNVILIVGVLSGLQATLTLPGIAGIILTIGMAVDANVLIYERIREEVKQGRTPSNAIETGYTRALSAILDANITTLIAAVLLFQFGSGPVRGFAVTLAIGIITSVFTAFVVSRLLVATWFRAARPRTLSI